MKNKQQFKIESEEELRAAYEYFKDVWLEGYTLEDELRSFHKRPNFRYIINDQDSVFLFFRDPESEIIENPLKVLEDGDYVIAPEGCGSHLTPGKAYKVYDVEPYGSNFYFQTIDNNDKEIFSSLKDSGNLNNQDWKIKKAPREKKCGRCVVNTSYPFEGTFQYTATFRDDTDDSRCYEDSEESDTDSLDYSLRGSEFMEFPDQKYQLPYYLTDGSDRSTMYDDTELSGVCRHIDKSIHHQITIGKLVMGFLSADDKEGWLDDLRESLNKRPKKDYPRSGSGLMTGPHEPQYKWKFPKASKEPMNRETFMEVVKETLDDIHDKLGSKGAEYADNVNVFRHFEQAAQKTGKSREEALQGMLVKHLVSIDDMIEGRLKPTKELIDEKFGDTIAYYLLLKAMMIHNL